MIMDDKMESHSDQYLSQRSLSSEEAGRLHQRSVCGEELTLEERVALQEWYEAQDREEAEQLNLAAKKLSVAELERRVEAVVRHMRVLWNHRGRRWRGIDD